ncbi:serine--tRNA ligase [Ancylobacter sp. 6x-1]|uniref:Serine--tRNA ligase n=1 Tax=Ancylobacter crimeensis TaxID=2579147 RepID=A0ABT0DFW2_9HYPH|nr:serine--tRNA ligase [Ancylobacter crimeensis]MCK0198847.1 serine--tRNA ligase [Ancylobacter crimeensis]
MHDIKWIREEPQGLIRALTRRGTDAAEASALVQGLIALDERRRAGIVKLEELQARRNAASKDIGAAKKAKDEAKAEALMAEVAGLKDSIPALEVEVKAAEEELNGQLAAIPNVPLDDVPDGKDETENVDYELVPRPDLPSGEVPVPMWRDYTFKPEQHFEIGEAWGLMDFEAAAKLSGSRFVVLKGQLARLERAIGQFFIDTHTTEHGYLEVSPPVLVKDEAMFGTAQLPKFRDDQFRAGDEHWLIPTAEVPLTNLVAQSIVAEEELPLRLTALTPCFRAEAGAAGRDTRGMIRQHQFTKCEMVSITTPDQSPFEHERMLACAQAVLKKLGLHFRVMRLCTGDMGFASGKTFDIEVWLPGQNAYREISSCSTCTDFQARRMNARYRPKDAKGPRFVHTLNGSGVAVGRALVAILETYQNADGSVAIPDVLRPYMGGLTRIEKP